MLSYVAAILAFIVAYYVGCSSNRQLESRYTILISAGLPHFLFCLAFRWLQIVFPVPFVHLRGHQERVRLDTLAIKRLGSVAEVFSLYIPIAQTNCRLHRYGDVRVKACLTTGHRFKTRWIVKPAQADVFCFRTSLLIGIDAKCTPRKSRR